jgi:hypothetical protein
MQKLERPENLLNFALARACQNMHGQFGTILQDKTN